MVPKWSWPATRSNSQQTRLTRSKEVLQWLVPLFMLNLLVPLPAAVASRPVPRIWTNASALSGEAMWVQISWEGIPFNLSATDDAVVIYADVGVDVNDLPSKQDPMYFILPFTANPVDWALGKGTYRFYLINVRNNLLAVYSRGKSFRKGKILASVQLEQATPNIPMHPHLAPTSSPTATRVIWYTRDSGPAPVVRWGTRPGRYSSQAAASVSSFTAAELCRGPANSTGFLDPYAINSAVMTNLKPGTRYYYVVGDAALAPLSREFSFKTAPQTGRPPHPYKPRKPHYKAAAAGGSDETAAAAAAAAEPAETDTISQDAAAVAAEAAASSAAASSYGAGISSYSYAPGHENPYRPCSRRPWSSGGASSALYWRPPYRLPKPSHPCKPDDVTDDHDGSEPLLMLAWADHGAYNPDSSRWFLGTFGGEIEQYVGTPDPGVRKSFATSIRATLGVSPANGAWPTTAGLVQEAKKGIYHAAVLNGDIAYAFGNIYRYDNWLHLNGEVLTRMPLLTSPGNHESDDPLLPQTAFPYDTDSGGECGVPYAKRLQPPNVAGPLLQWYSVNVGLVHFLQISTEQEFWPGSQQYEFIQKDLQSVDRSVTPWVIAGFHRPLYVDDPDTQPTGNVNVSSLLRQYIEPLFVKYQLDVTFSGHVHWYHRTCPVMKGTCVGYNSGDGTAKAPVHIIMGNAGGQSNFMTFQQRPNWMVTEYNAYGYSTVNVTRTQLTITSFASSSTTVPDDGKLPQTDAVTLYKPLNWKPNPAAAEALYRATPETPPEVSTYSIGAFTQLIIAKFASLAENLENLPLLLACFGHKTNPYKIANTQELMIGVGAQLWDLNAAVLTFFKAKYVPGATDPPSWQQTLDYAYTVVVTGRWKNVSSLPARCKV